MFYKSQFTFKGLYLDVPTNMVPDGAFIKNTKNIRIEDGILQTKPGYEKLGSSTLIGIPLLYYKHTKVDGTEILIALTETDIYRWDYVNAVWKMITELYNTGTVDLEETTPSSGDYDKVTLSGGTWDTSWDDNNTCYIGFDTDDPDSVTTWHEVQTIDSTTQITLKTPLGSGKTGVNYVLRKAYNADIATARWEAESFYDGAAGENLLIATNGNDFIVKWDGDIATPHYCEELANAPKAVHIGMAEGRILAGNIKAVQVGSATTLPYTLIWSDISDADAWTGGTTDGAGYQELYGTEGEIMLFAPFTRGQVIAKTDAIIEIPGTGDADAPFSFHYITKTKGVAFSTYCIINELIGLITKDDIVLYNGTPQLQSIAEGKIRNALFAGLNYDKRKVVHSVYSPRYKQWRIYLPKLDSTYPNETWVYDIETGEWYYDDKGFTASGAFNYKTEPTIDSLDSEVATIDELDTLSTTIDGFAEERAFEDVVTGDENSYSYIENPDLKTIDGLDIEATAVMKDFSSGNQKKTSYQHMKRISKSAVHFEGTSDANDAINMQVSVDRGGNYSAPQTFNDNIPQEYRIKDFTWNLSGRFFRTMFSGRYFKIFGYEIGFIPVGRR